MGCCDEGLEDKQLIQVQQFYKFYFEHNDQANELTAALAKLVDHGKLALEWLL